MKKTLAIVLALVLVLAMVPVSFAATTIVTDIDKANIKVFVKNGNSVKDATDATKIAFDYTDSFGKIRPDAFAEAASYVYISVDGFTTTATDVTAKVNGKEIDQDVLDLFDVAPDAFDAGTVSFPVKLPKGGLTAAYAVTVEYEGLDANGNDANIVERMTITVAGTDKSTTGKTELAGAVKLASKEGNAYLVGNVFYIDYEGAYAADKVTFTFADNKGALFTEIAYLKPATNFFAKDKELKDSAVTIETAGDPAVAFGSDEIELKVETKSAIYTTPKFKIVTRQNIAPEDVKGIYFAEYSKTIAVGETYAPVVLGVSNGLPVKAEIILPTDSANVQLVNDSKAVYGLRAGTVYVTAELTIGATTYEAATMKITVTGETYNAPVTKYVACRALNVRKGPGTSYSKVGLVYRGQEMKVIETAGGWSKVEYAGGIAYVCDKYLAK